MKGAIEHYNCNESSKINVHTTVNDCAISTKPSKSSFKVLIELKPGENLVSIDFCCSSLNIKLTYKRRRTCLNVVPMYIINNGHAGQFQSAENEDNSPESACKRILTGSKLLQCLIAEKLYEDGFGRKTFQIENDECIIFRSNLNYKSARKMNQEELWAYLGREIMRSKIGCGNKKYLGFLSCTKYNGEKKLIQTYEDMIKVTEGHIALGGGGLALFGSACLYTWPEKVEEVVRRFEDSTSVDKQKFMDDSCYRSTYGTCFTTTLGSVLHELCHTFDLGHTHDGIMDRGFDNIHKFFVVTNNCTNADPVDVRSKYLSTNVVVNTIIRNPNCVQNNQFTKKSEDDTYFTRSCSVMLSYHKFFNDYVHQNNSYILKFDKITNFVKSTLGIRVIEIRKGVNEMVDESWVFPGKILKYSFHVPEDCISNGDTIIIEDNAGNIFKEYYKI
ncbi:zinc metalloproteinase-related [Holotrichia oblita]|uniref:Zinc metalloproteinase-related n=1 Tax=Holotrichia oblita TaxID=644536 RepID=A0ACB9T2N1_HOLOL|nr:zinc metalloproteinase-related [Holotrichia oblita]